MGHPHFVTADLNMLAAAGFRDARTEQETGKERRDGDSSVSR